MDPAKHKRKSDRDRDNASPHDQHVRAPTSFTALENKEVHTKLFRYARKPLRYVSQQVTRSQKDLPATFPVQRGRRTLQPHRVAIGNAESREENGECVSHQRRIKVRQVARTKHD